MGQTSFRLYRRNRRRLRHGVTDYIQGGVKIEKYLFEQSLILIPFLNIIGLIIKQVDLINDRYIPLILLAFALFGSFMINGLNVQSAVQGVLVTGAAVYSNQVVKQLKK